MEVRYIEIKTSPAGQIIRAYTPEQYKKEMARRKNATARARKLTRLQERVGAALAMLGFLMLLGAGGMCEIGQIIGYGLAGLFLFVFGVFDLLLRAQDGVPPRSTLDYFQRMAESSAVDWFVVGGVPLSPYPFKITDISETWDAVLQGGVLVECKVSLTIEEYL